MLRNLMASGLFFVALLARAEPVKTFIGGGTLTSDFKPVVKLHADLPFGSKRLVYQNHCTATWITKRHLLTAAHCVLSTFPVPYGYHKVVIRDYEANDLKLDGVRVHINPALTDEERFLLGSPKDLVQIGELPPLPPHAMAHDLAVLEVPAALAEKPETYPLKPSPLAIGTAVTLVGYGYSAPQLEIAWNLSQGIHFEVHSDEGTGLDTKRFGMTTVDAIKHSYYVTHGTLNGAGEKVAVMKGDSGGPLLVRVHRKNAKGQTETTYQVAGVVSAGEYLNKSTTYSASYFASVAEPQNKAWLLKLLAATKSAGVKAQH